VTEKAHIVDALGERALLMPSLVNAALAANDRAKYFFTLLQTARHQSESPAQQPPDLRAERIASGVADASYDEVIAAATRRDDGTYAFPGADRLVHALLDDVNAMLVPLRDEDGGQALQARFAALADPLARFQGSVIDGDSIDRTTSGDPARADSLHLLVMDAHKALNRLQAKLATETVDGATAYGLAPADRAQVKAFMRGVQRTAPLRFDHPGLATTATRSGGRLVLQNDIGTTDAHVLVVHVDDALVTVTYTDVHLQRLLFFQSLFDGHGIEWEDTRSRKDAKIEDGVFRLGLGRYAAPSAAELRSFLEFLGSRLVFLIDWNKARKRLRNFVPNDEAIRLLKWAADADIGHMAFLKAGGEHLVFDALEFAAKDQYRIGEPMHELLGLRETRDYLRFVLRTCSELLRKGEPEFHVQDAVRAELFGHFRTGRQGLFDIVALHAAYVVEIAGGVRDTLLACRLPDDREQRARSAKRSKEWEKRADELVNRARDSARHTAAGAFFRTLVEAADDAADDLEEAAFHLAVLPEVPRDRQLTQPIERLGELLVQGSQEYVKAVEIARHVRRGGAREDMQDFLEAIYRLVALEQRTDEAERNVEASVAANAADFRTLYVLAEAAKNLEQAADGLMHCGLKLRDQVLGDVMSG
jgi:uncharacterized protein Yka (UPF0111/DUF47 family)